MEDEEYGDQNLVIMDRESDVRRYSFFGDGYCSYHSIKFSPKDKYIAGGTNQGRIDIFNVETKKKYMELHKNTHLNKETTYTCVRWRGRMAGGSSAQNIICSTNTHGEIQHWHVPTGKILSTMQIKVERGEDPQLNNFDYSPDFTKVIVCGAEPQLRLYDVEKQECVSVLSGKGGIEETGHSNRVFCVKYFPDDDNLVVSGGWDQRIILWDLRQGLPIHSLNNQAISGDAIDVSAGNMLSCSSIDRGKLSQFDIRNFTRVTNRFNKESLKWENIREYDDDYDEDDDDQKEQEQKKEIKFYTGRYSNNGNFVLVGAANPNEARILYTDREQCVCRIKDLEKGVITSDWNSTDSRFCFSGEDGYIRIYDINLPNRDGQI